MFNLFNPSIYKYVTDRRIEHILKKKELKFTQPQYLNDPFDMNIIFNTNIKFNKNEMKNAIMNKGKEIDNTNWEYSIKKEDLNLDLLLNKEIGKTINDTLAILCLTSKKNNLLMWAHYANEHKGFVVEFDKNHIFFKDLEKVNYSRRRYREDYLKYVYPLNNNKYRESNKRYLIKSKDWKYEQEYRIIEKLDSCIKDDKNNYLKGIPSEAIKAIYIGCRMSDKNQDKILKIINTDKKLNNIKIFKTKISDKFYDLRFEQIN